MRRLITSTGPGVSVVIDGDGTRFVGAITKHGHTVRFFGSECVGGYLINDTPYQAASFDEAYQAALNALNGGQWGVINERGT